MLNERITPRLFTFSIPTTGAGTSDTFGGPLMKFAGQVVAVEVTAGATIASDPTDYTTLALKNGSTTVASWSTASGAVTADTGKALTMSTTAANTKFAVGDQLNFTKTDSGAGKALTAPTHVSVWYIAGTEN